MKEEPLNKIYSDFLDHQRITPPENLRDDILRALRTKQKRKLRLKATIASAAAILAILFVLSVLKPWQGKEMEYIDKIALLLEAKSMLTTKNEDIKNENNEIEKLVIYEDEELLIYFK